MKVEGYRVAVAYPGFLTRGRGANLLFGIIVAENCIEMKTTGLRGLASLAS